VLSAGLLKNFNVGERILQFRWEMFNALNEELGRR
jgi:hypothetical protein